MITSFYITRDTFEMNETSFCKKETKLSPMKCNRDSRHIVRRSFFYFFLMLAVVLGFLYRATNVGCEQASWFTGHKLSHRRLNCQYNIISLFLLQDL